MQDLVGIIRTESELPQGPGASSTSWTSGRRTCRSTGTPSYNPGWNLATDLPAMLTVSRLVAKGALERRESRGGHTRDDYPKTDPELGKVNLVQRMRPDGTFELENPESPVPAELAACSRRTRIEEGRTDGRRDMRVWRGDPPRGGTSPTTSCPRSEGRWSST